MALTTLTQSQFLSIQTAAVQAGGSGLQDFSEGSLLRSWSESNGEQALWVQALILQVALLCRAATSQGSDLDSWMADFGFTRLLAVAATGQAVFSRKATGAQVVVAVGSTIETLDGTESFTVIADATNSAYSSTLGGYVMSASSLSVSATVQAVTAGSGGNVAAGTLSVISGSIPGVSAVTNPATFTTGSDAELDAAFRARFISWLNSLEQGTIQAVENAISGVQSGLDYVVVPNKSYAGGIQTGYFYAVVDDGSGAPSAALLAKVYAAIDAVNCIGTQFNVFGPVLDDCTVSMTIVGGTASVVEAAVAAYINDVGLGGTVEYTKLSQVAYNASSSTNVTNVLLNGGTADLVCAAIARPIATSVTVNQ